MKKYIIVLLVLFSFGTGSVMSFLICERKAENTGVEMYSNILNRDVWMLSSYKKGDIDYLDVELEMSIIELVNVIGISLKNDVGLPSTNVSNSLALAFSSIPELYSTESIKNKGRDVEGIKYLIEKQRSSD